MLSTKDLAPKVVSELLRDQPLSPEKVRFAWRVTVGNSMARATSVKLEENGTLVVYAEGDHWRRETTRSARVIKQRLRTLLGGNIVRRVRVKVRT